MRGEVWRVICDRGAMPNACPTASRMHALPYTGGVGHDPRHPAQGGWRRRRADARRGGPQDGRGPASQAAARLQGGRRQEVGIKALGGMGKPLNIYLK